jgi:hypothetical protein
MRKSNLIAVAVLLFGSIHANPYQNACSMSNKSIYGNNCVPEEND